MPSDFAVVFDFDGTVIDSETADYESHRRFFAECGVALSEDEWCTGVGIVQPDTHWWEWLCERTPQPPTFERFREATRTFFDASLRFEPMPGISALLGALVAAGVPRGIASTAGSKWVLRGLDGLGLTSTFGAIVTGDQVARGKPAPDVYLEAARRLKIAPERCVAVEDSEPGLRSARAAGMKTIAIPHPLTRLHDHSDADLHVRSAAELTLEQLRGLVT